MRKIEYDYGNNFNRSSKIMEFKLGIQSARLLSTLIYKYNYWLERKKITVLKEGWAFYITIPNLQGETNMKPYTIKKAIKQLKTSGLIKVKKIGLPAKNHYILNRSAIQKFDTKHKRAYKNWLDELYSKADEDSTRFMDNHTKPSKESMKTFTKYISEHRIKPQLAEKSPTRELVSAQQEGELSTVTKNKNTNIKIAKNKKLTQGNQVVEDDGFNDEEVAAMFSNLEDKYKNSKIEYYDEDDLDYYANLEKLIKYTRSGVKSPKDFFEAVLNTYLKKEFDGFNMSEEDEQLIYDCIINNPLFESEYSDIEDRLEEISNIKRDNVGITDDDIYDLMEFNDWDFGRQYEMIVEKLDKNMVKIKKGDRKARFGNLFVGIKEMSENYAKDMVED